MFQDIYLKDKEMSASGRIEPVAVQSSRMYALDLVRCLAMLMMVQGHVISELTIPALIDVSIFPWNVWDFARGLTAPLFLFVSGAVQIFANSRDNAGKLSDNTTKKRFRMGLNLIFIGYLLYFPSNSFFHFFGITSEIWHTFIQVNILQLIGVSLLIVLLLFKITNNNKSMGRLALGLSLFIFMLTPVIELLPVHNFLPGIIANYIINNEGSLFTIFPFTAFMLFGLAFGSYIREKPKELRYGILIKSSLILGVFFILTGILIYNYINGLSYNIELYSNTGLSWIRIGTILMIVGLLSVIYLKFQKFNKYFALFGNRALFIYIAHLVILYGSPWHTSIGQIYHHSLPLWISVMIAFIIIVLSVGIAYLYDYTITKYSGARNFYKYSFGMLLIYLVIV